MNWIKLTLLNFFLWIRMMMLIYLWENLIIMFKINVETLCSSRSFSTQYYLFNFLGDKNLRTISSCLIGLQLLFLFMLLQLISIISPFLKLNTKCWVELKEMKNCSKFCVKIIVITSCNFLKMCKLQAWILSTRLLHFFRGTKCINYILHGLLNPFYFWSSRHWSDS